MRLCYRFNLCTSLSQHAAKSDPNRVASTSLSARRIKNAAHGQYQPSCNVIDRPMTHAQADHRVTTPQKTAAWRKSGHFTV
jgi:hypothetical protein